MGAVADRAELLKELRAVKNSPGRHSPRSLSAVARAAGMDLGTLSKIAAGAKTPRPETVARLRAALLQVRA